MFASILIKNCYLYWKHLQMVIIYFQSLDALGAIDECPGNSEFKRQSTSLAIQAVSLLWNLW